MPKQLTPQRPGEFPQPQPTGPDLPPVELPPVEEPDIDPIKPIGEPMRDPIAPPERQIGVHDGVYDIVGGAAPWTHVGMVDDYAVRRVVSRFFPNYDRVLADRLIAWLDNCGYRIVLKRDYVSQPVVPTVSGEWPLAPAIERCPLEPGLSAAAHEGHLIGHYGHEQHVGG